MKARWVLALATLAVAVVAAPAQGATWKQVTDSNGSIIDQVGLFRTADGVLHVAWHHPTGVNTEDLLHTAIAPEGKVGATTPIQSSWAGLENPALVNAPGGIRAFWGGIRSTNTADPNQELNTALSVDGGATWVLQPGSVVPLGAQPYGSPVAASTLPDGTPLEAWAGTLGTWVHSGLTPLTPNNNFQPPLGNYGYDTGIASDTSGQTVLAWYSNATGHLGYYAQSVNADGTPVGAAANFPGSSKMNVGQLGRTPIVARPGGGFYLAAGTGYPTINRVRLWRVGASGASLVAATHGTGSTTASVAAAADGRLWVVWKEDTGGKPRLLARRSNKAATGFGATVDAGAPKGAASLYRVDANAYGDSLDAFGVYTIGTASKAATYYTRILPGLTLSAKPEKISRTKSTDVTFTVLDAGDPVAGAKVTGGGDSATTDARGKAKLTLKEGRSSVTVRASADGYTADSLKVGRKRS